MPVAPKCSECGESLAGRPLGTKTCSTSCRQKRSRRLARQRKAAGRKGNSHPPHIAELSAAARDVAPDIMRDVLREEARPIAREALTEDVLRATQDLLALTPLAVQNIALDMASGDERVRQKATEFVLRYTLGNAAIAPSATNNPQPMQVVLNWPTAGGPPAEAPVVEITEGDVVEDALPAELRECMWCRTSKPPAEFVGVSDRCQACHDEVIGDVRERFGEDAL